MNLTMNNQNEKRVLTDIRKPDVIDFHDNISKWLLNPEESYFKQRNEVRMSEYIMYNSPHTIPSDCVPGNIILIQQFYLPANEERREELRLALRCNCKNDSIDKIVLLNERIYTEEELGVTNDKIEQIDISQRLTYRNVFEYSNKLQEDAYIVLSNCDIFFDAGIARVKESGMVSERKAYTLLRHEYNCIELKECKLFGPRCESQDTWIWNSKWKVSNELLKLFNMNLGLPGCDNKIIYLLNLSGFICHNEPEWIKCYHIHQTAIREYADKEQRASKPYYGIFPVTEENKDEKHNGTFNPIVENNNLHDYVKAKLETNTPFLIPRMAGIENEVAAIGAAIIQTKQASKEQVDKIQKIAPIMKNNAGIKLTDINEVCVYSQTYLSAFQNCERYFWWAPWGNVSVHIAHSWDFIVTNFKGPKFDALALDVFSNIQRDPWTLALKGKRILIISSFIESIREKIDIREKIYGIDLFPECEFVFLKPPQTHGSNESRQFKVEFAEFVERINAIKDTFDVALCSCGGYGNPICSAIYGMGKSAIYVGGVLQMYFGIYGERWMREHPDVLRAYMNQHWSRPKENEKPNNYKQIENNCYW